jgi:beta-lactam-binding protein with PASTA domain
MAFTTRVFGAGKLLLLAVALIATYVLFAAASARIAIRMREVRVPDLKGRTLNEATAMLGDLGLSLKVDEGGRRSDPRVAAGRIATQEPEAAVTARRGRNVKVWLSAGPRVNRIPRLTGETERTAQLRIQQDGLTLGAVSEIRSGSYPAGMIVAQEPAADSTGNQVSLLINRGERASTYLMPDLIGVNGDRAADLMRWYGFRVAVVGQQPYPGVPAGVVLRQSPQAGFQIGPGEAISLEVSR